MSEAFGRALCSASSAQVIKNAGFEQASTSSVETLADVLKKYVEHLCSLSQEVCEHSGRTEANLVDVTLALSQVGTTPADIAAFVKAAQKKRQQQLLHASASRKERQKKDTRAKAPGHEGFRWKVVNFPLKKTTKQQKEGNGVSLSNRSFDEAFMLDGDALEAPKHIPGFLPTFPSQHTYVKTDPGQRPKEDGHALWLQLQQQKQDAEVAVLNLEEREREDREKQKAVKEAERRMQIDDNQNDGDNAGAGNGFENEGKNTQGEAHNAGDNNGKTKKKKLKLKTSSLVEDGFVPEKFSHILHKLHGTSQRRKKAANGRIMMQDVDPKKKDVTYSSSALKDHPHTLSDLEATQMKQALYQSGGATPAPLQDSMLLGSDILATRQARQKWQQFKKGGWKPDGVREEELEMDFIQREKLERAERILKLGVEAAIEEEL